MQKKFGRLGTFTGHVDGVDDNSEKEGHRVFHITYSDGDEEWIEVDELIEIMLPPGINCVRYNSLDCFAEESYSCGLASQSKWAP